MLQLSVRSSLGTNSTPGITGCCGWKGGCCVGGPKLGRSVSFLMGEKGNLCFWIKRKIFCLKLPCRWPVPVKCQIFCWSGDFYLFQTRVSFKLTLCTDLNIFILTTEELSVPLKLRRCAGIKIP